VAQTRHVLATTGVYEYVRHPQYGAFIVIMFGFLMQWPALLMLPVLVMMCVRLARMEEREAPQDFGDEYRAYMRRVPAFLLSAEAARTS
jgi:methanethiol S-methyltransferase